MHVHVHVHVHVQVQVQVCMSELVHVLVHMGARNAAGLLAVRQTG